MQILLSLVFSQALFAQNLPAPIPTPSDLAISAIAQSLNFNQASTVSVSRATTTYTESRELIEFVLHNSNSGETQILVSGPKGFTQSPNAFSTLFISAGFMSGQSTVGLVENPGDTILVGYQYPFDKHQIQADPSLLYKSMLLVPGQMALAISWLSKQSFVNTNKFHVMGVSLGSLLLPVTLRLNQMQNVIPTSTLLCFGGSEYGLVFDHVLSQIVKEKILRGALVNGLANLLAPYNPKLHLPHLQGPFFTLYAEEDQIFPKVASLEQFALLPEPKEMHWITGPHIDVDQPEQIAKTMELIKEFIAKF